MLTVSKTLTVRELSKTTGRCVFVRAAMSVRTLQYWLKIGRRYCQDDPRTALTATVGPAVHDVLIHLVSHGDQAGY